MNLANQLRLFYLLYFAKPASDRIIHRAVYESRAGSLMEIGMGQCQRALRLIRIATMASPISAIRYVGVDPFELREPHTGPGYCLKDAYRLLRKTQAQIQLLPGDPFSALARMANWLKPVDVLVVSAGVDQRSMDRAWFYIPRILHDKSLVFRELRIPGSDRVQLRRLGRAQVERLGAAAQPRRAA